MDVNFVAHLVCITCIPEVYVSYTGMRTLFFENTEQYIHDQGQHSYVITCIVILRMMPSIL